MSDPMVLLWVKGILEIFEANWTTSRMGNWLWKWMLMKMKSLSRWIC